VACDVSLWQVMNFSCHSTQARCLWNALGCIVELLGYLLRFVSVFFRTRASLAARLLAAEIQLSMCKRRIEQKLHPKPRFSRGFRILWVSPRETPSAPSERLSGVS
jgi:hypothetical protein